MYPEFHSLSLPSLTVSDNQIDHRTVRNLMESPIVKTVLSTGVDRQNVMQAIERRLRETGKGYIDRVSLISLRSCFLKLVQNSKIDCILTLKA